MVKKCLTSGADWRNPLSQSPCWVCPEWWLARPWTARRNPLRSSSESAAWPPVAEHHHSCTSTHTAAFILNEVLSASLESVLFKQTVQFNSGDELTSIVAWGCFQTQKKTLFEILLCRKWISICFVNVSEGRGTHPFVERGEKLHVGLKSFCSPLKSFVVWKKGGSFGWERQEKSDSWITRQANAPSFSNPSESDNVENCEQ